MYADVVISKMEKTYDREVTIYVDIWSDDNNVKLLRKYRYGIDVHKILNRSRKLETKEL